MFLCACEVIVWRMCDDIVEVISKATSRKFLRIWMYLPSKPYHSTYQPVLHTGSFTYVYRACIYVPMFYVAFHFFSLLSSTIQFHHLPIYLYPHKPLSWSLRTYLTRIKYHTQVDCGYVKMEGYTHVGMSDACTPRRLDNGMVEVMGCKESSWLSSVIVLLSYRVSHAYATYMYGCTVVRTAPRCMSIET